MFAPRYHEFARGNRVKLATSLTWATGILSFNLGFNAAAMMFAHILDTVTDPFYVLFDRDGHIAQYGWAAGACDDEEIREASGHNAQIGTRSVSPFLFEEL